MFVAHNGWLFNLEHVRTIRLGIAGEPVLVHFDSAHNQTFVGPTADAIRTFFGSRAEILRVAMPSAEAMPSAPATDPPPAPPPPTEAAPDPTPAATEPAPISTSTDPAPA